MFVHPVPGVNGCDITAPSHSNIRSSRLRSLLKTPWRSPFFRELLMVTFVALVAVLVLRAPAEDQGFSIDESRWISSSRYFWVTFVDGDLFGPAWQPNYVVMTHPPVARYLIGLGLWLQGWQPGDLNGRYDSLESRAFNQRAGNVPTDELLEAARRVTFLFAVAAVILIYGIGRILAGQFAGIVAAGLALANPLLSTVWTRALAESIVATFSLLTLLLAASTMPWVGRRLRYPWVPLVIGVSVALAAATKLNGGIGAVGLGVYALGQQGITLLRTRRTAGFRSWVDIGLPAIIVFVLVNPLLYVNPVERTIALVQHRQDEMEFQQAVFDDQAVPPDLALRAARVGRRVFDTWATPEGPLPLSPDVVLTPAGIILLLARGVRRFRARTPGPELLFLCWLASSYGIVTANLGFDSSHYYAPIASLNVVLGGVAIAAASAYTWVGVRQAGRALRRTRLQKTQTPAT